MLEIIGIIAIIFLVIKIAPKIIEYSFKFSVICLGLLAVAIIWAILYSDYIISVY